MCVNRVGAIMWAPASLVFTGLLPHHLLASFLPFLPMHALLLLLLVLVLACPLLSMPVSEVQSLVEGLQFELQAAQAAADLEATKREFRAYLSDGECLFCIARPKV